MDSQIMEVSSAENLSLPYYDKHFHGKFEKKHLPILDTKMAWIETLVENKFFTDARDLVRLSSEATRASYPELINWQKHLIWVHPNPDVEELKRLMGICQKAGILFHHCYFIEQPESIGLDFSGKKIYPKNYTSNWVAKIKQIRTGYYKKALQRHSQPSRKLSQMGRMLSLTHLISEDVAQDIAEELARMQIYCPRDCFTNHNEIIFIETVRKIIGFNQDGSTNKKAINLLEEWMKGEKKN